MDKDSLKSKLIFKNYIVNKVELNNNFNFDNEEVKVEFDINSKVDFINDNDFFLKLFIEIFKDAEINNYPFNFKLELIGIFKLEDVEDDEKMLYAEQNGVAILFPYVRALITNYTAASNIQPLILPPINVVKYIQNKK